MASSPSIRTTPFPPTDDLHGSIQLRYDPIDSSLFAQVRATGDELWRMPACSPEAVVQDAVILRCHEPGGTIALDVKTGDELWRSESDAIAAVAAGAILASDDNGALTALDYRTGKQFWRLDPPDASRGIPDLYLSTVEEVEVGLLVISAGAVRLVTFD